MDTDTEFSKVAQSMYDARFWRFVDITEDCWIWTGSMGAGGYGNITRDGKRWRTHRWVWVNAIGPIRPGMQLDHLCRVRSCVRPSHLEMVTGTVNVGRGMAPSAIAKRTNLCKRGHTLSDAYVKTRANGKTYRVCRTCALDTQKRINDRRREQEAKDAAAVPPFKRGADYVQAALEARARHQSGAKPPA